MLQLAACVAQLQRCLATLDGSAYCAMLCNMASLKLANTDNCCKRQWATLACTVFAQLPHATVADRDHRFNVQQLCICGLHSDRCNQIHIASFNVATGPVNQTTKQVKHGGFRPCPPAALLSAFGQQRCRDWCGRTCRAAAPGHWQHELDPAVLRPGAPEQQAGPAHRHLLSYFTCTRP
jgi:hypothetical protein